MKEPLELTMKELIGKELIVIFLVICLSASGCATALGRSSLPSIKRAEVIENALRKLRNYEEEISPYSNTVRSKEKIIEDIRIEQNLGFTPPYVPVIQPAEVKKVWIPAHKSEKDPDVLVAGHWIYIKIRDESWFIELESPKDGSFAVIIPTKGDSD